MAGHAFTSVQSELAATGQLVTAKRLPFEFRQAAP